MGPPIKQWNTLRNEFREFNVDLLNFPSIAAANKTDLPYRLSDISELENALRKLGIPLFMISALSGDGIPEFIRHIASIIQSAPKPQREKRFFEIDDDDRNESKREKPVISRLEGEGRVFVVNHPEIERLIKKYNFEQDEALGRFSAMMRHYRVEELLLVKGAREGDTILIGDIEFNFLPEIATSLDDIKDNVFKGR
ncbi:MAG: hypothetical protein STSR0007_14280 [Thermovirga sp.]